jgi:beta-lactamase superfamily II metal-dependent hydrolase
VIFTLEALQAAHGDALLLHYGQAHSPMLAVVDAGPSGIYRDSVRPRLEQIRAHRAPGATMTIDFVVVSHIDDDHIHGITDLTKELVAAAGAPGDPPFAITNLWHNAFTDVVDDDDVSGVAAAVATASLESDGHASGLAGAASSLETALVLASVGQGDQLRRDADRLSLNRNDGKKLLVAPAKTDMGHGLKVTIVGPLKDQLEALQREWDKSIKRKKGTAHEQAAAVAAYVDDSIPNLSSIVLLLELHGKRMLLTGDARGDFVLAGLKATGHLKKTLHLDVLKVPHHGSNRDVEKAFFKQVTADHYVISANGKYGNPDTETLEMLAAARGDARFTIHLTNHKGERGLRKRLDAFYKKALAAGAKFKLVYLGEPDPIRIELRDPLGY